MFSKCSGILFTCEISENLQNHFSSSYESFFVFIRTFVSSKLVAALGRCQLSIRHSVYILQAVVEAIVLKLRPISFQKIFYSTHTNTDEERMGIIHKSRFSWLCTHAVTAYWDEELLHSLDMRSSKEEWLCIIISFKQKEKIFAIPKSESSSGKDWKQVNTWNLNDNL